jgi:succinoglycan biosynthesis transport protein ExoP
MFERLTSERDGSQAINALRRQWWVILLVTVIAGAGAYVFSNRKEKKYAATSALLFVSSHFDQTLFGNQVVQNTDPARQAATNQALVALPTVADLVATQYHIAKSRVHADVSLGSDSQSDVLTVTVTDPSPVLAARIANAYVLQYIAFRQAADRAQLAQAEHLITTQLAAIPLAQRGSATAQNLQAKGNELQLLAQLQTGDAQQVQVATPPTSPSSPNPTRDAMIGLILGLVASCALVLVLARRDRRIKTAAEIEELYGVPVIGTVPESSALRGPGATGTPREQDAFRMIRAQLRYFDVDRDIKRVMVTSSDSGEGKSLIALNLARAAGRTDNQRALLIEADLRRPSLTAMIGLESVAGLSELLSHSQDLASGLRELVVTPEPLEAEGVASRYDVLLAGATPPNPVELLESKRMAELMDYAESVYDIVIIDTPPIGVVSDPISLVHQVDGVVVISRVGRSRRDHAARLMKQLRGLNAHVLGVVINGFEAAPEGYGYYGYYGENGEGGRGSRLGWPGRQRATSSSRK